ncbi:MAG TPA: LamG domain-containing protein [Gemmataceae bacterium]
MDSVNSPFWIEARNRAEGRAHTPATRTEDARTIPGNLCGVCGAPLPQRKRRRKPDDADIPTVLPADKADGGAPPIPPDASQAGSRPSVDTPLLPRSRAETHKTPASATSFLGLDLLTWCLIGGGFLAVVLLGGGLLLAIIVLSSPRNQPMAAPAPPPPAQPQRPSRPQPRLAQEPPPATQFPGLLAYWSFDEGKETRAADSSGNGLHAKLVNAGWTQGIRGKALNLTGPDSYLDYSDSPRLSFAAGAPFTIALWTRTQRAKATLLSQRNSREGGALIDIVLKGGRVQGQVRQDRNDVFGPVAVDGGVVNDGGWHHVALTRDGDLVELFLDALSQGRNRGDIAAGAITTDLRALGSERFWIARNGHFGDPHFQGNMDELCIFDRALKPNEITALAGR